MMMRPFRKLGLQLTVMLLISQCVISCNLSSAIGFNDEGLPVKEISGNLVPSKHNLIDHSPWDTLLKKYVHENGLVDYKGFLKDRKNLKSYLKMLSQNPPKEQWSKAELLAYYINTYNAYTIDLILANYPVKSIKEINGPWTKAIIPIGDKHLSLGGLENSILRKMNEPRIHFAINCASYSCPNLLNEAFTADKIERQLEKVSISFINGDKNQISKNGAALSHIFKWYKKDFVVQGEKDLIAFINQYSHVKIDTSAKISYMEYDWNLNEIP
jgi:Protein of unknown function, DUF547